MLMVPVHALAQLHEVGEHGFLGALTRHLHMGAANLLSFGPGLYVSVLEHGLLGALTRQQRHFTACSVPQVRALPKNMVDFSLSHLEQPVCPNPHTVAATSCFPESSLCV